MTDETAATRNAVVTKNAAVHTLDEWKYHVALTWGAQKKLLHHISAWKTRAENWQKGEVTRLRAELAEEDTAELRTELEALVGKDLDDVSLPTKLAMEQFDILGAALAEALVKVQAPDGEEGPLDVDELRGDHAWALMQMLARLKTPEEVMADLPTPAE